MSNGLIQIRSEGLEAPPKSSATVSSPGLRRPWEQDTVSPWTTLKCELRVLLQAIGTGQHLDQIAVETCISQSSKAPLPLQIAAMFVGYAHIEAEGCISDSTIEHLLLISNQLADISKSIWEGAPFSDTPPMWLLNRRGSDPDPFKELEVEQYITSLPALCMRMTKRINGSLPQTKQLTYYQLGGPSYTNSELNINLATGLDLPPATLQKKPTSTIQQQAAIEALSRLVLDERKTLPASIKKIAILGSLSRGTLFESSDIDLSVGVHGPGKESVIASLRSISEAWSSQFPHNPLEFYIYRTDCREPVSILTPSLSRSEHRSSRLPPYCVLERPILLERDYFSALPNAYWGNPVTPEDLTTLSLEKITSFKTLNKFRSLNCTLTSSIALFLDKTVLSLA